MNLKNSHGSFFKILQRCVIVSLIISGILVFFFKGQGFGQWFLKGVFTSCLNFIILYLTILKSINKGYHKAFLMMYLSFLIRSFLSLSVLYSGLTKNVQGFVAALLGLQVIKFVIFSNTILGRCP